MQMKVRFTAMSRLLGLALLMGLLVVPTGCAWFKKGKQTEVTAESPAVQTPQTPTDSLTVPTSAEPEGPRPGDLLPLPELHTIYFDYDRANIRADQLDNIEANLQYLQANPDVKVLITGHTDERGTVEYNFNLGLRRAQSVRDYYMQGGISGDRLQVQSRGEEEPVALGHTEEAWARNRRAEFQRMF